MVPEVKRLRLLHWRDKNGGKRAAFPKTYVGLDFLKVLQVLENHAPCACAWTGNYRMAMKAGLDALLP